MTTCANQSTELGPAVHHMTNEAIETALDGRLVRGMHHRDTMTGLHVRYGHPMYMATRTSWERTRDLRARDLRSLGPR